MTKADRGALWKRLRARGWPVQDWELAHIASEVDRAVSRERALKSGAWCHDCGGGIIAEPALCEDCFSRRREEGMDTGDMRKFATYRRGQVDCTPKGRTR
jgi:hypothetical protein